MRRMFWNLLCVVSIITFVVLELGFMARIKVPIWDEAVYIGIGKYIFSLGHQGLWEMIRPLALPLVLGLVWRLGFDPVVIGQFIAIVCASACLLILYLLAVEFFDRFTALIAVLLCAASSTFFLYSTYILTDIPAAMLILLALLLWVKGKNPLIIGFVAALGMMMKFPCGLLLIILPVLVWFGEKQAERFRSVILFVLGALIILVPFVVFNLVMYAPYTGNVLDAAFRPLILAKSHESGISGYVPGLAKNLLFYPSVLLSSNLLLVFSIVGIVFLRKRFKLLAVLGVGASYLVYFTSIANKQDRFVLFILPFVCLLASLGLANSIMCVMRARVGLMQALAGAMLAIIIVQGAQFSFSENSRYYGWRPASVPPIVHEFYEYPRTHGVEGPIYTTDPLPVVYNDNLFIPFYFMSQSTMLAYNEWESSISPDLVFFSMGSFPCLPDDESCVASRYALLASIESSYVRIFNATYDGSEYLIFQRS